WYYFDMARIADIVETMRRSPTNVRFLDLRKVCEHYFGAPRQSGSSHMVFRMPWRGDPRVNIQISQGKAKAYQVRQVLQAIDRMEDPL
ncbi:MAG: toxin HicA, partial [Mycobacteriales bacterium]